jgi:hypothetical protein
LGIVAGKLMIYNFVIVPAFTGQTDDLAQQREFVATMMTLEELGNRGGADSVDEAEFDSVYASMERRVAGMSGEQVREAAKRYRQDAPEVSFAIMFELLDIVFIGLALVTAFRLAGSGFTAGGD